MKSLFSILLVLVILFSFVACSSGSTNTKDTTPSTTKPLDNTDPSIVYEEDDLPNDLDFGGQDIHFLVVDDSDKKSEICTDELNSDVVNDSVYNREKYVEERLGVEIIPEYIDDSDFEDAMEKQFASDEDQYQIYGYITFAFTRFVFMDHLVDLYDLDYIDLDKPWWSSTFNSEAEVMESLYLTTGSLSLSLTRYMFAMFYNKSLANDNAEKYPELLQLYEIVDSGNWTYDKFYELGSSIYIDNNGSSTPDKEDTYGIGFQRAIGTDVIWSSFDINILSSDGDGWFELDVPTEKLFAVSEKLYNLINNTPGCYDAGISDGDLNDLSKMFAGDQLLFMNNKLLAIESATLRNMQSDYGILPFPKYDSNQKEYYTYAHDSYTSFGIPKTNRNPDVSAAVLEAMASYSYRETAPAYFDTALKGKYMSDPQSRKMLDLVVNGFTVDTAWIYIETIGASYPSSFRQMYVERTQNYSSNHVTHARKVQSALKTYKMFIN
ncbi:MAG: hypothetical protein IKT70_07075 [Clostridia bacterium]|nr:hypothetical protein [Clostridia bacterium]